MEDYEIESHRCAACGDTVISVTIYPGGTNLCVRLCPTCSRALDVCVVDGTIILADLGGSLDKLKARSDLIRADGNKSIATKLKEAEDVIRSAKEYIAALEKRVTDLEGGLQ